jgi:hypothetical protein
MTLQLNCPKCKGQMQEGLVVDFNYAGVLPSMWVQGQVQMNAGAGSNMNGKKKIKTVTYRCADCGYLDSYAK